MEYDAVCFVSGYRRIDGVVPPYSRVKRLQRNYSGVSSGWKDHWDMPTLEDTRSTTITHGHIVDYLNTHKKPQTSSGVLLLVNT